MIVHRGQTASVLPSEDVIEPWIQFNVVLVNVVVEVLGAEHFCNSHQLRDRQNNSTIK